MNIFEELKWRGLVADCTDANVVVEGGRVSEDNSGLWHRQNMVLYAGFDPTADSLHVGNLVPLLALRRFQLLGHHPIALAGGATGSIGDPSGKTAERQLLTKEILDHNIASVKLQLAKLLDFDTKQNPARLLDLHPVRPRPPVLAARPHLTRHMNGTAEQQQLFGQRGLARVGMGNDGERAAARNLVAEGGHQWSR